MFLAHMPSAVSAYISPHLYLDRTQPVTELVGYDNISVWNTRWRKGSDHIPAQELAHHVMLSGCPQDCWVGTTFVRFVTHAAPPWLTR